MARSQGFWARVEFPDGSPNGLRIATKGYWTARIVGFPKSLLDHLKNHEDLQKPGVYVLRGRTESDPRLQIYVGRAEPRSVHERLVEHDRSPKKAFWEETVAIVSATPTMPVPAHYLEARLIDLLKTEDAAYVDQNSESLPPLSPMDEADAISFLRDALLCLRALGFSEFGYDEEPEEDVTVFDDDKRTDDATAPDLAEYALQLSSEPFAAFGRDLDEGRFQVLPGSDMAVEDNGRMKEHDLVRREDLLTSGHVKKDGSYLKLQKPADFNDRVQAKAVLRGSDRRGTGRWHRIASPEEIADGDLSQLSSTTTDVKSPPAVK